MEDSEFSIHLFSNASLQNYPENTLSRFSVDLARPLYLGDNQYKVALSEIFVPPGFPLESTLSYRDCIVYEDVDYATFYTPDNFEAFINVTMRMCALDPTIYDRSYFRHYTDPNILFHPNTIRLTHPDDVTSFADTDIKKYFNLNISDLFDYKSSNAEETPSAYLPPVRSDKFQNYFQASSVTIALRRRYTLKQVLWTCIEKILTKTRMETFTKAPVANPLFAELKGQNPTVEAFEKKLQFITNHSRELIRRFIARFVSIVEKVRETVMIERSLKAVRYEKYLIVYCDICADRLFAGTRAKILSVFDYDAKRDFSVKLSQLDYSRVDRAVVHTISILLLDEHGEQLNLQPSQVPTHVCLKLKRA